MMMATSLVLSYSINKYNIMKIENLHHTFIHLMCLNAQFYIKSKNCVCNLNKIIEIFIYKRNKTINKIFFTK